MYKVVHEWLHRPRLGTALAVMNAKQPAELTRDDVLLAASDVVPSWIVWSKGAARRCPVPPLSYTIGLVLQPRATTCPP